jgi:NAD dependent epimerase/dehydratase family enzyme
MELANAVGRPAIIPVPKFALRLTLGEFADSLFYSQHVVPNAILASGYQFKYPDLSSCLSNLIK